jgi:hypothetical protein
MDQPLENVFNLNSILETHFGLYVIFGCALGDSLTTPYLDHHWGRSAERLSEPSSQLSARSRTIVVAELVSQELVAAVDDGRRVDDASITSLAPDLVAAVGPRRRKTRLMSEALLNNAWILDISSALSVHALY